MKKKIALLLLSSTMLLASCAGDSIYGTYSFNMGEESSANFKVSLELTDKVVEVKEETSSDTSETSEIVRDETTSESSESSTSEEKHTYYFFDFIFSNRGTDQTFKKTEINGGYYVLESKRLELRVQNFISEEGEIPAEIPESILDTFLTITITPDYVNVNIPVSLEDSLKKLEGEECHTVDIALRKEKN